jgi:folylpolyglutamate synthase
MSTDDEESLYASALAALFSTEHQAVTKEAIEKTAHRRTRTVHDMHQYMKRIGLLPTINSNDDKVSVIHVAGTKGKGSVCAMCEAIIRTSGNKTMITGLFTSPHLVDIRERIRINGRPISKSIFAQAYWSIRNRLEQYHNTETTTTREINENDANGELPVLPGYFRMITLMAIYIFKHYISDDGYRVSCIILEVGMGGRYDATNIIFPWSQTSTVCGITLIDYDHVRILGNTLPEIAWEKGGIYTVHKGSTNNNETPHPSRDKDSYLKAVANIKDFLVTKQMSRQPRCFALDTNDESVINVFRLCASNEGEGDHLLLAGAHHNPYLPENGFELGLKGTHQLDNAELAIALCLVILQERNKSIDKNNIYQALADMTWPGRCQSVAYPNDAIPVMIRLDGAHTIQSLRAGLEWYNSIANTNNVANLNECCRILIFNCSHERNPVELLDLLYPTAFHAVHFCRADSERPSAITKASISDLWRSSDKSHLTDTDTLRLFDPYQENGQVPTWQDTLLGIWKLLEHTSSPPLKTMDHSSNLNCTDALNHGLKFASKTNTFTHIEFLCTGSLYLVGSMLSAIQWHEDEASGLLAL